jgi:predicted nucleotidyltransferase
MISDQAIQEISNQIAKEFSPQKIILFGSYARKEANEDSDLDLMVIMNFTGSSFKKSLEVLNKVNPKVPVDLIVRNESDFNERILAGDPFILDILETGEVLYEHH